ncbi:MAG: 3-oxoacyl-acyl-carrier protein reductase [Fusobacteria bacterium]|nr:MAG: 3-oxoacyl-acyl-carrier protein reductase [Fusobacteriota bacterium]KAF0228932.1 MAG: 3-oxoacyl-acyl-carrier protein [Fusobacteriota bacterium]
MGKVVFITGGTTGIGKAIAQKFSKNGYNLALNYFFDEEAEAVKKEFEENGVKVLLLRGDIRDSKVVAEMIDKTVAEFSSIDVLINNAGITKDGLLLRMKDEEFDAVIDTNLKGAFYALKFAAKHMAKQRSGRIVNIASVVGLVGNIGQANYAAAKAGLIGVTKTAAKELASRNILVNAIAPGFIETVMTAKLSEEIKEAANSKIPLGRFGKPEEIASAVYYLGSDENTYITGQVLTVDGGMVI